MSIYDLPKFKTPKITFPKIKFFSVGRRRQRFQQYQAFWTIILVIFISSIFGFLVGAVFINYLSDNLLGLHRPMAQISQAKNQEDGFAVFNREQAIIQSVKRVSPAVVSIIITKDLPAVISPFEGFFDFRIPQREPERREVGWGSGFIVSPDGLILTNRHVVLDEMADYTVILNDGREFPAEVIARDRVQDLAILKIETKDLLPIVELGDSTNLQIGQTVITIGNMLGEFQNSVSVGVVSGLGRTITARGGGLVMRMEDVIQTDAAINQGNSGGPLLNLRGEVIGINTAMVLGAENIGFAIPVNQARKALEDVKRYGRIIYPFLGVRYVLITERIQREHNLARDYGAWVLGGRWGESAIFPGSAAEKAGIKENDIILEFNQEKITPQNSLARIIVRYNPGDKVALKILRDGHEKIIKVVLGEKIE